MFLLHISARRPFFPLIQAFSLLYGKLPYKSQTEDVKCSEIKSNLDSNLMKFVLNVEFILRHI